MMMNLSHYLIPGLFVYSGFRLQKMKWLRMKNCMSGQENLQKLLNGYRISPALSLHFISLKDMIMRR